MPNHFEVVLLPKRVYASTWLRGDVASGYVATQLRVYLSTWLRGCAAKRICG